MVRDNGIENTPEADKSKNKASGEGKDAYEGRPLKGLLLTTSVGIAMVVSILIGLIIGIYLDKYFESRPWFTIIFIILGVVAGFKNLHRTMKEHGF